MPTAREWIDEDRVRRKPERSRATVLRDAAGAARVDE
jgi:hypothetical protein